MNTAVGMAFDKFYVPSVLLSYRRLLHHDARDLISERKRRDLADVSGMKGGTKLRNTCPSRGATWTIFRRFSNSENGWLCWNKPWGFMYLMLKISSQAESSPRSQSASTVTPKASDESALQLQTWAGPSQEGLESLEDVDDLHRDTLSEDLNSDTTHSQSELVVCRICESAVIFLPREDDDFCEGVKTKNRRICRSVFEPTSLIWEICLTISSGKYSHQAWSCDAWPRLYDPRVKYYTDFWCTISRAPHVAQVLQMSSWAVFSLLVKNEHTKIVNYDINSGQTPSDCQTGSSHNLIGQNTSWQIDL